MRIRALLGMAVLVAVPSLPAFAQVWNTGVYAVLDGGAVMVGEANDVAAEVVGDAGDALPKLGRDWEFTLGAGGAAGIGYDFGVIRLDGGVTYLSTGIRISRKGILDEDANEDTFTLLAATGNAWYDIDTGSPWTLYFGGGFGTANLGIHLVDIDVVDETDDPDYTFSTWSLAFQAGAGIGYTIADFMVIDLGYRLLGSIDPELVKLGSIDGQGQLQMAARARDAAHPPHRHWHAHHLPVAPGNRRAGLLRAAKSDDLLVIHDITTGSKERTMILTTTPTIQGRNISAYRGIVTGEAIIGANIFKDFFAGIRDIVGGRSAAYEAELRNARELALAEMSEAAEQKGGNAVVGIDLDYEVVGQGGSMLMVAASGTAVSVD